MRCIFASDITRRLTDIPGILMHNLSSRKETLKIPQAHKGKVSGLCFSPDGGERLLSCGVDRTVKLWAVDGEGTTVSHPL